MAELIERQAAIDAVTAVYVRTAGYKTRERIWEAREAIQKLPAAGSTAARGEWVAQCIVETDGGWTLEDMPYNEHQHSNPICSICRKTALLDGGEDYVTSPYCPACGAKMDGKGEEA